MAASMGKSLQSRGAGTQPWNGICRNLPGHLELVRSHRSRTFVCRGLALPNGLHWPFWETISRLIRKPEQSQSQVQTVDLQSSGDHQAESPIRAQPAPMHSIIAEATATAIHAGLRLTGIALRLAKTVVDDMRRSLSFLKLPEISSEARASLLVADAAAKLKLKMRRDNLQAQGKDVAFMQMLQCLDRCHIDHDAKWALFTQHTADKAEFCERWQHLYHLAKESKVAVDTLLRPDASRSEINQFWRSAETSAIIAEEDALKQLVFAQVLQAGNI